MPLNLTGLSSHLPVIVVYWFNPTSFMVLSPFLKLIIIVISTFFSFLQSKFISFFHWCDFIVLNWRIMLYDVVLASTIQQRELTIIIHIYWRRQWHPTPGLLPGKSHGWRSLVGCSPWGCEESDMTERLHFHFSLSCTGEPTPVFLPGESQGWRSLVGCRLWGCTESDTTDMTQQQQQNTHIPSLLNPHPQRYGFLISTLPLAYHSLLPCSFSSYGSFFH